MQFGLTPQPLPSKAKCRQCQVDSKQERRQKSGSEAQVGGAAGTGARLRARLSKAAGCAGCSPGFQREGKDKEAGDQSGVKQASCLPD